ncbi:MAG TPA: PQQ-binding-like beta-propeller repeat protein [Bryobacteraceae bacterium]|nr:PQQ-binding-like beta-propeller repeat protein [Bryobacteraceae bacterium]
MKNGEGNSLRLWPGVAAAVVLCLARFVLPPAAPDLAMFGIIGGVVCALAILLWWLFFSRAPWSERIGAVIFIVVAIWATTLLADVSMRTGMRGMLLPIFGAPLVTLALVAAVVATRRSSATFRRAAVAIAILLVCAGLAMLRTEGIKGSGSELAWRWTKTPEERLLAEPAIAALPPAATPVTTATAAPIAVASEKAQPPASSPPQTELVTAEWPGFRGPQRDSVVRGLRINTDWSAAPPTELWRRPIGPGWSSFAVAGDLLYTQEQRGNDEIVACYKVSTGEPVWSHRDPVRFWESNAGAGPRSTPTLNGSRVFALGATGILNALDSATGRRLWSRNIAADTDKAVPEWGFASSPLVIDNVVVVAAASAMAGYDADTGKPRWQVKGERGSYSSPHQVTVDGVVQVVMLSGAGAVAVDPATGAELWKHPWEPGGSTIVQPAVMVGGDILINGISGTGGHGIRRIAAARSAAGGWNTQERWTSSGLKPYFNDFVVHKGHAYGFDGNILSCIDLEDGKRKWKGGRYGNGQLVLLADQDVLLVLSEDGELALVSATTGGYQEIAKRPALNAKTWNHPVVVRGTLLVRNGEEMAAFKLAALR